MILQTTKNTAQVESDTNIFANIALLQNLSLTIESLTNDQYVWQYDKSASSIGKHIRHIIDHYNCFFKHLAQAYIDYDDRARETAVETKTHQACKELSNIILQLSKFNAHQAKPIWIYITAIPDMNPEPAASSLQRELLFLQSHTIHHMAVIQLLLNRIGISVDSSFALAPSTVSYNHRVANYHA